MQVNKKKFGLENANIVGKGSLVNQNKCVPVLMYKLFWEIHEMQERDKWCQNAEGKFYIVTNES